MSDHPKEAERNLKHLGANDGANSNLSASPLGQLFTRFHSMLRNTGFDGVANDLAQQLLLPLSVSVNAKRDRMNRIFDDNMYYSDVFRLLSPAKVGLELALVSRRFDALVDTQFKSRKWSLGKLTINAYNIVKTNDDGLEEKMLPFPQTPLPNSVVGFAHVYIYSTNSNAIAFLKCIGRLLDSDVSLHLKIEGTFALERITTSVWPLLNVSGISKVCGSFITSPILRDLTILRMVVVCEAFRQFSPDDSAEGQTVCKWLHTPCADGQPKVVKNKIRKGEDHYFPMDAFKATFLDATASVSFIILLSSVPSVRPFEGLVNSLTREQLTCREVEYGHDSWQLIERSPIDKNAEQWAKWVHEALDDGTNEWKVLLIFH